MLLSSIFEQKEKEQNLVFEFADVAIITSSLRDRIPLTCFKEKMDESVLLNLKEEFVEDSIVSKLKVALHSGTSSVIDVETLIHYLALTSTKVQFGIDFNELDVFDLIKVFRQCDEDFNLNFDNFRMFDLDEKLLYNMTAFHFVQRYKEVFKFTFNDAYEIAFQHEELRLYRLMLSSQSKLYNFLDQIQENILVLFDCVMSQNDDSAIRAFVTMHDYVEIIESLLYIIKEYKIITKEDIRLELSEMAGMIMYLIIEISGLIKYSRNLPNFLAVHTQIIEKLVNCMEHVLFINKKCVIPLTNIQCTPLSSPMGRIVTYNFGLIQCILDSIICLIENDATQSTCEMLQLSNLLCHAIQQLDAEGINIKQLVTANKLVISQITQFCGLTLKFFEEKKECALFICNLLVDILIQLMEVRIYIASGNVIAMISKFTFETEGTEEIKQKCCFLLEKLKTKNPIEHYFKNELMEYAVGTDKEIDSLVSGCMSEELSISYEG